MCHVLHTQEIVTNWNFFVYHNLWLDDVHFGKTRHNIEIQSSRRRQSEHAKIKSVGFCLNFADLEHLTVDQRTSALLKSHAQIDVLFVYVSI